jgi:hypothetical protein
MSEQVNKLSLLEQFKQQHAQFIQQRDLAQNNINQLIGAIYACETMIKKFEEDEASKSAEKNQGDNENVGLNNQNAGQTA